MNDYTRLVLETRQRFVRDLLEFVPTTNTAQQKRHRQDPPVPPFVVRK
jgi:hypothetical protein